MKKDKLRRKVALFILIVFIPYAVLEITPTEPAVVTDFLWWEYVLMYGVVVLIFATYVDYWFNKIFKDIVD